ncbi:DNA helicase [Lachancea thermotolerans]
MERLLSSLNERQCESVTFDHTKALQVVAGPGTGKTKVLTTRVAYLLLEKGINPGDIIITTFTKKATLEMIERLSFLLEGTNINPSSLWIGTFHSICARVLRQHGWKIGLPKDWRTFSDSDTDPIIHKLVEKVPDQIRDYAHSYTRKANLLRPNSKGNWEVHPASVKKMISWLKSEGVMADEYRANNEHDPALLHFYEAYQCELHSQHALDFDDLLLHAFKLLSKERCLPHIKHVLVDEFQDTNSIQLNLMYLFARGNSTTSQGITAVGDPDQSIYAFRNALASNFEDMAAKCPIPCSRIVLVENYRSSQKILTTSEMLIKQQLSGREDRLPLKAQFDSDFPPVYIEFPAKFLEARALAREILYLRSLPKLWNYNSFALLVRHRRQIRPLETSLIEHRIPYKIVNGRAFWELKEINGLMDLLKCVYSNYEKNAILRALQYPNRGLGPATVRKVEATFADYESPFVALKNIVANPNNGAYASKALNVITEFLSLIESCRELMAEATDLSAMTEIFDKLYEGSGLKFEYLHVDGKRKAEVDPNGEPNLLNKRHINVNILRKHLANFKPFEEDLSQRQGPGDDEVDVKEEDTDVEGKINAHDILREFINSVNLYSTETEVEESQMSEKERRQKKKREKDGFVTISTIHGAKGLEWPVVMIPGCVEGVIPCVFGGKDDADDSDSATDGGEEGNNRGNNGTSSPKKNRPRRNEGTLDEERRMFFVAQTRAKFLLYLTATNSNDTESRYESSTPSRFLTTDLVNTMCEDQKVFTDVESVRKLYHNLNQPPPQESATFSLDVLVKDYEQFVNARRERLTWKGRAVFDASRLNLGENITPSPTGFGITTAAAQLRNASTNHIEGRQNSSYGISGVSHNQGNRNMAPVYRPSRNNSNTVLAPSRTFAPKTSPTQVKNAQAPVYAPKVEDSAKVLREKAKASSESANSSKIKTGQLSRSASFECSKRRTGGRSRRTIVADSINLGAMNYNHDGTDVETNEGQVLVKGEMPAGVCGNLNKTAGEMLHNPRDLRNDSRPILTNAKTLADSVRSQTSKRSSAPSEVPKKKVKSEPMDKGYDIMSRLSQARRRADSDKDTVIVID